MFSSPSLLKLKEILSKVFFSTIKDQVEDRHGNQLKFIMRPSKQMISIYKDQIARMQIPAWYWDESRTITLENNPVIKFDQVRKVWYNQVSEKVLEGLPCPILDTVVYDDIL
jgi:hypothetical protein